MDMKPTQNATWIHFFHPPPTPTFNPPSYPGLQLLAEERFSMEEKMGVCLRAMTA